MKTLLSMTDFVLEQKNKVEASTYERANSIMVIAAANIFNYAAFLKQSLKLEMFVPVDEMGEIMNYEEIKQSVIEGTDSWDAYEKAREKVLFEGFDVFNSETKNPDIINRNLGIIICFNSIISVMIEGANGYGGFSDSEILIEQLSQYNLQLTPTALKQIGL